MDQSQNAVARLVGAVKNYGEVRALDGFDLELQPGEVMALLGPNGAGKTTAVSLLLGQQRADHGEVMVFGHDPQQLAVRARLGAMLQTSGLTPTLTVAEHIDCFRSYYPRPASVEALVAAGDLDRLMDRRSGQLSGGEHRRLFLALALAGDPELVFLDEPSAGMDIESRRRLWSSIRQVRDSGRTVLLTTHHLEEADALADRVAVIDHGRLVAEGTPSELQALVAGRSIRCVTAIDIETLRAMDGVTELAQRGAAVEILTTDAESVLRQMFSLDTSLRELEVGGAGLEQAFLALTQTSATEPQATKPPTTKTQERAA